VNYLYQPCSAAIVLLCLLLIGCSTDSTDTAGNVPMGTESSAGLVEFRLGAFADLNTNLRPIRSFPTDQAPILSLTEDTSNNAPFSLSGTGTFSSRCTILTFEYRYQFDVNQDPGRNIFVIDTVRSFTETENEGCDPGQDVFEFAASDVALPLFSGPMTLTSDLTETILTLRGPVFQLLSFHLEGDTLTGTDVALPLTDSWWTVVAYRFGTNVVVPAPASDPLLIRFNEDGDLFGNLRCQSVAGTYETEELTVSFSNIIFTHSGCASEQTEASVELMDAVTLVMSGPASAIRQGTRLYLSANDVTLVLEGRELLSNDRRLNTSVLATGNYPIPSSELEVDSQDLWLIQAVRNAGEFNALWIDAVAQGNDLGPPPTIDFERSVVMYLRLGLRPHLNESMRLRGASANDEQVLIEVDTRISDNDAHFLDLCGYDDDSSHLFSFVLVSNEKPIPDVVTVVDHQSSSCSGL